jgi:hypothetical protein
MAHRRGRGVHDDRRDIDDERDGMLARLGVRVLHVRNEEVLEALDASCAASRLPCSRRGLTLPPPRPRLTTPEVLLAGRGAGGVG